MIRPNPGRPWPAAPARGLAWLALAVLAAAAATGACGKKGPPLAPLVRVPIAAQDLFVRRRADQVDVQFRVPQVNDDSSRPADVRRVDVYAFTGEAPRNEDLVKHGTLVASVPVRKPPEEQEEEEAPAPVAEGETPSPPPPAAPSEPPSSMADGFQQGDLVEVVESIGPAQRVPVTVKPPKGTRVVERAPDPWKPILEPEPGPADARLYVVVGVNHKGRRGRFSPPQAVSLLAPPEAPGAPALKWDEKGLTLTWAVPPGAPRAVQAPAAEGELASKPLGLTGNPAAFNVYDAAAGPAPAAAEAPSPGTAVLGRAGKPLNEKPLTEPTFGGLAVAFGTERCLVVRTVVLSGGAAVESAPSPPACAKPIDTFAPAAPRGLAAVASGGAISLIWEANTEADLAGYLVLRAAPGGQPKELTPQPITETTYRDETAARGVRYLYTVVAVDTAGNRSPASTGAEESAR